MKSIVYIDEQDLEIENFLEYFDKYEKEINVITINPKGKAIEQVVEEVVTSKCSLVAIDYYLKYADKNNTYNGDDLLSRIKDRKPILPIIIFTSDKKNAREEGFMSPEIIIRDKIEINKSSNTAFKDLVFSHIEFYEQQIKKYKSEFANLRKKQANGESLTAVEKRRIIELNIIIEEIGDRQLTIVPIDETEFEKINSLMVITQKLIDDLNTKNPNV